MKIWNHIVLSATALLTACATVPDVNIDPSKFNGGGGDIATTKHAKEKQFFLFTKEDQATQAAVSGLAAIPVLGVLGAAIAGGTAGAIGGAVKDSRLGFTVDQFSKTNGIVDPKVSIEKTIVAELARQYNLVYAESAQAVVDKGSNFEDMISKNSGYPYILDVTTTRWMLHEGETDKFSMKYSAKMSLIETGNKRIIAQGSCTYESPSAVIELPKLRMNDLGQFNSEITYAVDACVKQFSEKNLALKTSAPQ